VKGGRARALFFGLPVVVTLAATGTGIGIAVGGGAGPSTHSHHPAAASRTTAAGSSSTVATGGSGVTPSTTQAAPVGTAPPGPPYRVASSTLTLVDTTRPSPARGSVPGSAQRTLRTVIRAPVAARGPLPLVVFGPGYNSTPETYEVLLDAWAATGYLVAAPDFPGSASDLPGPPTESDIPEQARDLSFVITSLLGGAAGPVDRNRIAVAGHSDGGSSVVMLAANPAYADTRIAAYLVLAGQIPDGVAGPWNAAPPGVLACMVGTNDEYDNLSLTTTAYDSARMTKALVTVPGGDHLQLFVGMGAVPDEVRAATVRFLAEALGSHRPVTDGDLAATLAAPPGEPPYEVNTG